MLFDKAQEVGFLDEIDLRSFQGFTGDRMPVHIIEAVFLDKLSGIDDSENMLLTQAGGLNQLDLSGAEDINAVARLAFVEDRLMFIVDEEFLDLEEVFKLFAGQIAQIAQAFHDTVTAILDRWSLFHDTISETAVSILGVRKACQIYEALS